MMTFTTSRQTTTRTIAAAAAVAAASTLAACSSSDSQTAADAPAISSATSSTSSATPSSSSSSSTSATSSSSASTPAPSKTTERASRSQQRQAAPAMTYVNWTQVESVPNATRYVYSADLPKGVSKVTQAGQAGAQTVTYRTAKSGEKVVSTQEIGTKVTRQAVRRVVTIGTGAAAQEASTQQVSTQKAQTQVSRSQARQAVTQQVAPRKAARTSSAQPVAANEGMWDRIAQCESTNNWSTNTGNGYYGGLQFDNQTWLGAGGGAYAPRADLASKAQQIAIANKVYSQRGLSPWACGSAA